MGDQLSCTYQLMGRQKVEKKKYIKPTQSLPNIISRTQNTDTHTKNYARQAQHTGNMCYGGFSLWQVQTDCSELRDKYWKKTNFKNMLQNSKVHSLSQQRQVSVSTC